MIAKYRNNSHQQLKTYDGEVLPSNTFVTTTEAAKHLNLSESTMEAWRLKGLGPVWMKFGRSVRYRVTDLENFIALSQKSSPQLAPTTSRPLQAASDQLTPFPMPVDAPRSRDLVSLELPGTPKMVSLESLPKRKLNKSKNSKSRKLSKRINGLLEDLSELGPL